MKTQIEIKIGLALLQFINDKLSDLGLERVPNEWLQENTTHLKDSFPMKYNNIDKCDRTYGNNKLICVYGQRKAKGAFCLNFIKKNIDTRTYQTLQYVLSMPDATQTMDALMLENFLHTLCEDTQGMVNAIKNVLNDNSYAAVEDQILAQIKFDCPSRDVIVKIILFERSICI